VSNHCVETETHAAENCRKDNESHELDGLAAPL
jgi:hypothetical protein